MVHHAHPHRRVQARDPKAKPGFVGDFIDDVASVLGISVAHKPQPQQTLTSYVYTTLSPTFTGSIGGYLTAGDGNISHATADPTTAAVAQSTPKPSPAVSSSSLPSAILAPSTSSELASSLQVIGATPTTKPVSSAANTAAPQTRTSASQPSATSSPISTDTGLTPASQAGLAIGIILGVGALVSLLVFCFRQRKKKQERQILDDDDEKDYTPKADFADGAASTRTARTMSTAPRLSLRPVTQFLPNLGQTQNQGHSIPLATSPKTNFHAAKPRSAWERPMTSDSQNRDNPFGNHAEAVPPKDNPFGNHAATTEPLSSAAPLPSEGLRPAGNAAAGAAGAPPVVGLARGASKRGVAPKPLDFTKPLPQLGLVPPSPTGTEFSVSSAAPGGLSQSSSAAAIAAAGGPQNSSVHRVQLDFKPSMDDELELQAGQLIRLLHEYDDGWALCIRLDRSQQGVVPRTCLSTRPVKPRVAPNTAPRGQPPPGMRVPQQRAMSPAMNRPMSANMNQSGRASPSGGRRNGPQGRPMSPAGGRPMTPNGGRPMSPAGGRPMTPNGGRSKGPSQQQSYQGHERRVTPPNNSTTPPNGSPPNRSPPYSVERKPVPNQASTPGQAL